MRKMLMLLAVGALAFTFNAHVTQAALINFDDVADGSIVNATYVQHGVTLGCEDGSLQQCTGNAYARQNFNYFRTDTTWSNESNVATIVPPTDDTNFDTSKGYLTVGFNPPVSFVNIDVQAVLNSAGDPGPLYNFPFIEAYNSLGALLGTVNYQADPHLASWEPLSFGRPTADIASVRFSSTYLGRHSIVRGNFDNLQFTTSTASRALAISKSGTGSGGVTTSPSGIDCGGACSESFREGIQVELQARPDPGSIFSGWSGDADCVDGFVDISTAVADIVCAATFTKSSLVNGGQVFAWGVDVDLPNVKTIPVAMEGLNDIVSLAAGPFHTVALDSAGAVWEWGANAPVPALVSGLTSGVVAVAAGGYHRLALKSDGTVWAWGDDGNGQLGDGSGDSSSSTPVKVKIIANEVVVAIAAGYLHSLALLNDGSMRSWGNGTSGQLGHNTDGSYSPQAVRIRDVTQIAAGAYHSMALLEDGTVRSWGAAGLLGNGTNEGSYYPTPVQDLENIKSIATGSSSNHSLAITSTGQLYAWGYGNWGQLGDGSNESRLSPVLVDALADVVSVSTGELHTLAITADGSLWSWGDNSDYILGDGTTTPRYLPGQVGLPSSASFTSGGYAHSLAILSPPRPDWTETSVSNPPAAIGRGMTFAVSDTAMNLGPVNGGATLTYYYLGPPGSTQFGVVGGRSVPALAVGESSTGPGTVTIPMLLELGTYRLFACANDGDVFQRRMEYVVSNNCIGSDSTVEVMATLDGLNSSGPQGGPFTPLNKILTIPNPSPIPINWTASKLHAWTTLSSTGGTIPAGGSVDVTVSINSAANGLAPGIYSDAVTFINTTNGIGNSIMPISLTVSAIGTDLVVESITTSPDSPVAGLPVSVTVKVRNQGTTAAGSFYVDFYMDRSDPPAAYMVGLACSVIALAAGDSFDCDVSTSYASAGTYNMYAQVDTDLQVSEADESNNVFGPQSVVVQPLSFFITIDTSPAGRQISVDGTPYTAPQTFSWEPGTSHDIEVASPQSGGAGIRYAYSSWSDGGARSHTITTPSEDTTYTADFTTQYALTTAVNPGGAGTVDPSCADGCWYDSEASVILTATPSAGFAFGSWSGDFSATHNPALVSISAPLSVTANFIFSNVPPTPGPLTPSVLTSVPGTAQNLSAVYSDVNGYADLKRVFLRVNLTNTAANGFYVMYDRLAEMLYLYNDAGTGYLGSCVRGAPGTLSNPLGTLDCAATTAVGAGNLLTVGWNITPTAAFSSPTPKNVYLYAFDMASAGSGWADKGNWTIGNAAPTLGTLAPTRLTSAPGEARNFTAVYRDANGYADLKRVFVRVNTTNSGVNGMYAMYDQPTNLLRLYNDAGTAYVGSCTLGTPGSLGNSQGTLDCAATSVAGLGNDLTLVWNLTPTVAFESALSSKNVYLYAYDQSSVSSGWADKGDWTIMASNTKPTLGTLTPSVLASGPGIAQSLSAVYSDVDGFGNLKRAFLRVNTTNSGANGIYAMYDRPSNQLYLYNDAGTGYVGSCAPGTAGLLSNSRGVLDCALTTVTGVGYDLTISWNITPKEAFASHTSKNLYLYAYDISLLAAGWADKGNWTINP